MGLSVQAFRKKVTSGSYKKLSDAKKAIPRFRDWTDEEKDKTRKWVDKKEKAEAEAEAEANKGEYPKLVKDPPAKKAPRAKKDPAPKAKKDPVPKVQKAKPTKSNGAPKNGLLDAKFDAFGKYLNVVERVSNMSGGLGGLGPAKKEIQEGIAGALKDLHASMPWPGKGEDDVEQPNPQKAKKAKADTVNPEKDETPDPSTPPTTEDTSSWVDTDDLGI